MSSGIRTNALVADKATRTRTAKTPWNRLTGLLLAAGLGLMGLNIAGLFLSLRPTVLETAWPGRPIPAAPPYEEIRKLIENLDGLEIRDYVQRINGIVHQTVAHIRPEHLESAGYDEDDEVGLLNLRVPIWENYLLYILSYVKPDTYRRYEFCSYEKAIERGVGQCGQQSLVVVSLLHSRGIEAGFVDWGDHHVVAVANVGDDEWYILDPDYNVSFPYYGATIKGAEPAHFPELSRAYLTAHPEEPVIVHPDGIARKAPDYLYKVKDQVVTLGGPTARWGRACPIERVAYALKWVFPVLLILPWLGAFARRRSTLNQRAEHTAP